MPLPKTMKSGIHRHQERSDPDADVFLRHYGLESWLMMYSVMALGIARHVSESERAQAKIRRVSLAHPMSPPVAVAKTESEGFCEVAFGGDASVSRW